jgi:hypothetical protein
LAAALVLDAGAGGWSVGVTTLGGFTGLGRGDVLVRSSGEVAARGAGRPGRPAGPCAGTLAEAELQRIAAAVEGSKPQGWAAAKLTGAAPDAFGYVLELRRGDETHKAAWHDNTRGRLPPDLAELYAAVEMAWQRVVKQGCDES